MKFFVLAILIASAYTVSDKYQCVRDVIDLGPMKEGRGISTRGSYDVKTLLTYFDNLPSAVQMKVKKCGLNLTPAKERCEGVYGKDNCEQMSPAAFQTKCDKYFKRVGCCHCAMECPDGYTEDDYHCIKPEQKTTKVYNSKKDCASSSKNCEQRGSKFTPACGIQFKRVGVNNCLPVCPEGWHDEGKRCRKPADYRMAQPFLWQQGDN